MGKIRDKEKKLFGEKLRELKRTDKNKLAEVISSLSDKEAEELLFDDEVWLRDEQWLDIDGDHQLTLVCAGRGFGKDLDINTPVLTYNRGWTILDDIQIGDMVFNEKGEPVEVLDKYYPEVKRDMYKFIFNDGDELISSVDHEWHCATHKDITNIKKTIKSRDMFALTKNWYELGLGKVKTTGEIISEFYHGGFIPNFVIPKPFALQYAKHIPVKDKYLYTKPTADIVRSILTSSEKSRVDLMRCFVKRKSVVLRESNSIACDLMDEEMAKLLLELVVSLGETQAYYKQWSRGKRVYHRVAWRPHKYNPFTSFTHPHAKHFGMNTATNFEQFFKRISKFEKVDWRPTACLSVSGESSLWLAGRKLTPTHNTRTLASTVKRLVEDYGVKKITILAATARDLRFTIAPAIEGVYAPSHPNRPKYYPAKSSIEWPNGAMVIMISAEAGEDAPRGTQCEALLMDEAAFYDNNEGIITQALLTCRLGMSKAFAFTTPKATKQMIEWLRRAKDGDETIKIINGSTMANEENLSKTFINTVVSKFKGTRLERVELHGELVLESEGALLNMDIIERNIVGKTDVPRIVEYAIGVDVALTSRSTAAKGRRPDSTGVVVAGMGEDGLIYTIGAHTGVYSVDQWTNKLSNLFSHYNRSGAKVTISMEQNAGGVELLSSAISKTDPNLINHVEFTWSGQGKMQRASPYTLMVEQGRIKFVDDVSLQPLHDELISYTGTGKSPDNMDAWTQACMKLKPHKPHVTKSFEFLI